MENTASCNTDLTKKGKYNFEITTTQLCNMRCTYCFENIGGFLEDKRNLNDYIPGIIDKANKMLEHYEFKKKYDGINFVFWGGESSMNMKMIRALVDEFAPKENCSFFMYSNGYSMDTLYNYLAELKQKYASITKRYQIQFSYDGKELHDQNRFGVNGELTSDTVIKNMYKFYDLGFYTGLKSTIKHDQLDKMVGAWKDFDKISRDIYSKYGFHIKYGPTIDENHKMEDNYFEMFKESIKEIAKLELQRNKDGLPLLLSWWNGIKATCAVNGHMGCFGVDGNYYVCHAGSYANEETKKEFKIADVKQSDEDFLTAVFEASERISSIKENKVEDFNCESCSATNCPRCEVIVYDKSQKETFDEKWTDYNVDYLGFCRYWKFFGIVDRALQIKLSRE